MRVEFTRPALRQLDAIDSYIRERNPRAAAALADAMEAAVRRIVAFPAIGRRQDEPGVRKVVVRPGRYVIYYRAVLDIEVVRILAICHPAQRRPYRDA